MLVRAALVSAIAALAIWTGVLGASSKRPRREQAAAPADVQVTIDPGSGKRPVVVFGKEIPVIDADGELVETIVPPEAPPAPATRTGQIVGALREGWAFAVALMGFVSVLEVLIVIFSRRWDGWLTFHASRLAGIRPDDETPPTPAIAFDLGWLFRKLGRRMRGYFVVVVGFPALLPLQLIPVVGSWLFTGAALCWTWYWLGVFAAGKSGHAWVDAEAALPPLPLRTLQRRVATLRFAGPIRWYARVWAWVTRPVNAAVTTFERAPLPFLGLALARAILALPGLYFLARPIIPIAAGRLCADADPDHRFANEVKLAP